MYDIVITVNSHFSNRSVICCTDALLPNHKKCPVFHDGQLLSTVCIYIRYVIIYACVDIAAITMTTLQVICQQECESGIGERYTYKGNNIMVN